MRAHPPPASAVTARRDDRSGGLPTPAAGFDFIQNHVDLLSGKVHAVPTRLTATAADAADIIRDMCLRSGDGFPDILLVDHDSKFISEVFRAFVNGWGSCLVVGVPQEHQRQGPLGVLSDTLRACANGRKGDWDSHLPLTVHAINNAASTLGGDLTPFFVDCGHPRLPLSPSREDHTADESPAYYAQRMRAMEATVRELPAAAQAERKAKLDAGRVDAVFKGGDPAATGCCCGPRSCLTPPTSVSCARGGTAPSP